MRTRSCGSSEETLIAAVNSFSNSIVRALRRSGRLRVTIAICGLCFSINTTGISCVGQRSEVDLNLDDAGVKSRMRHWARDVLQQLHEHVARLMRLNDGIDPPARGAVANISLFFVILFHFLAQIVEFFVRRLLIAAIPRPRENSKDSVGR